MKIDSFMTMNPKAFDSIVGQDKAIKFITACLIRHAVDSLNRCYLLSGPPGVGKTSIAHALAEYLGIEDVSSISSGDGLADRVREVLGSLQGYSLFGSGERLVIINEVDKMSDVSEVLWLDGLENIPPHAVVVMTTNYPEKISQRIIDRTKHVRLVQPSKAELQAYVNKACEAGGKTPFAIPADLTNYRRAKSLSDDYILGAWEPSVNCQSAEILDSNTVALDLIERIKKVPKKHLSSMLNYLMFCYKKHRFFLPFEEKLALKELEKVETL